MTEQADGDRERYDKQLEREGVQRAAALGKRAKAVLRGDLGPVLKRWVSSSIVPVAGRLRALCTAILGEDYDLAASLAASPVFGLPSLTDSGDLSSVLTWALKPNHAEDLTLAVLGTVISTCAIAGKPMPLTALLAQSGGVARETALGQFLTQVQGAKSMERIRKGKGPAWGQGRKLDAVAALLAGQVRTALDADLYTELRGRKVVKVLTADGTERRIDLRPPEKADWDLLEVARHVRGERDPHVSTWASFAMLVVCAAQAEAGWFDLAKVASKRSVARAGGKRRPRSSAHGLVLSDAAHGALKGDLDKWLRMGFTYEPMIVPPSSGDYLSVKHREIAGGRGPMGIRTDARGTAAWNVASEVMAGTVWSVPERTLQALRDSDFVRELAARSEPDEARRELILADYRRHATDEIYFPLFMDFRGRVYSRSNLVTYQGRDMQKALLCFPNRTRYTGDQISSSAIRATVLHASALYAGPEKLDKASWEERWDWWQSAPVKSAIQAAIHGDWEDGCLGNLLNAADEPMQLLTALTLQAPGQSDRLACQIDGTCNGLQHLSALFGDATAAPWVNLCSASISSLPSDIYAEVARRVSARLRACGEPWASRIQAAVKVDRKLCKKPVMVLPYGGTRMTIEEAVLEAILDQEPDARYWQDGDPRHEPGSPPLYADWLAGGYDAFRGRDLKDHPLLHLDAKRLGAVVWAAIEEILPKPIAAMQAFRDIAKAVGRRSLEWDTGFTWGDDPALWVVQAKAKSARTSLHFKGLHLPGSVRGLQMRAGRDEIDGASHTTGIVANFIHSLDASHMVRTMAAFRAQGGRSFGAIHDCFMTRPSEMADLKRATREAFANMYAADPLAQPVRLRGGVSEGGTFSEVGKVFGYASWYALAEECGVSFPERGRWDPSEVLDSAWFFS